MLLFFPELLELSLIYREGSRQVFLNAATWPYPAQEYAPRFAGFKRLTSFSFNYRLNHVTYSPIIMRSFEDGFGRAEADETPKVASWEDCKTMFFMFAAHAPTLETLDFVFSTVFRRKQDGSIEVSPYGAQRVGIDTHKCSTPARAWENLPKFAPYCTPRFTALSSVDF